ncbi:hypothetical protein BDFB_005554 [Asbolus verrucosus]|uniref:Uncharacterized protein n=1 Tax=Asbolus verrucosus TaxID=1661398 RepID=A0A482VS79_ASBVE|nr:hypothetical protein BDFB_005554 [Asbolus verrucosus]
MSIVMRFRALFIAPAKIGFKLKCLFWVYLFALLSPILNIVNVQWFL